MGEVGYKNPPINTRFKKSELSPRHTQKHPNGYLTPILKKLLNKEMAVNDPEVQKVLGIKSGTKAELKKIIMLRYILNAIQGENQAIEGIIDRVDGKVAQALKGEGFGGDKFIFIIKDTPKGRDNNRVALHTAPESAND